MRSLCAVVGQREFRENRCRGIFSRSFHICWPSLVKFRAEALHIVPLIDCEFLRTVQCFTEGGNDVSSCGPHY